MWTISAGDIPIPPESWSIIAGAGFNGFLVISLLWYGAKELRKNREEIRMNTETITLLVLSMEFLPKQFHEHATKLHERLSAARKADEQ